MYRFVCDDSYFDAIIISISIPKRFNTWITERRDELMLRVVHAETLKLNMAKNWTRIYFTAEDVREEDGWNISMSESSISRTLDVQLIDEHRVVNAWWMRNVWLESYEAKGFALNALYPSTADCRVRVSDNRTCTVWYIIVLYYALELLEKSTVKIKLTVNKVAKISYTGGCYENKVKLTTFRIYFYILAQTIIFLTSERFDTNYSTISSKGVG